MAQLLRPANSIRSLFFLICMLTYATVYCNMMWYDGETGSAPLSALMAPGTGATEVSTNPHAGTNCLSLVMNASSGWAHVGLTRKNWATANLTAATSLEFWARSASGTVTEVEMELHGTPGGCSWIYIRNYLSGGITTTWQKVTIPASAFVIDKAAIHTVDFWLGSGSASFFVDDMQWVMPGGTSIQPRVINQRSVNNKTITNDMFDLKGSRISSKNQNRAGASAVRLIRQANGSTVVMVR
jgi:hypothetical protein